MPRSAAPLPLTGDADDVALPLVTERVDGDLVGHLLLVEDADETLILNVDKLLCSCGGVGDCLSAPRSPYTQRDASPPGQHPVVLVVDTYSSAS